MVLCVIILMRSAVVCIFCGDYCKCAHPGLLYIRITFDVLSIFKTENLTLSNDKRKMIRSIDKRIILYYTSNSFDSNTL